MLLQDSQGKSLNFPIVDNASTFLIVPWEYERNIQEGFFSKHERNFFQTHGRTFANKFSL